MNELLDKIDLLRNAKLLKIKKFTEQSPGNLGSLMVASNVAVLQEYNYYLNVSREYFDNLTLLSKEEVMLNKHHLASVYLLTSHPLDKVNEFTKSIITDESVAMEMSKEITNILGTYYE